MERTISVCLKKTLSMLTNILQNASLDHIMINKKIKNNLKALTLVDVGNHQDECFKFFLKQC